MVRRSKKDEPTPLQRVRCAIYTRKSHEEGLDQEFNSLDQQREAGEAYVESQKGEGWTSLSDRYDDPAFSAATLERPALRQLLTDIELGRVDVVIVYKIDRLSRSLRDFGRLMDIFERHGVSFVSVTQRFDTSTSMGKLILNVLMSFAEFEREVIGERIRDKIAGHKRRGKHTGSMPVLGYDTVDRKLVVNAKEAQLVRHVFERFRSLGSATKLAKELNADGRRTKSWTTQKGVVRGGRSWNKGHIYRLLNNRKYVGEVEHKAKVYPGEHDAIVSRDLWDHVQAILRENHHARGNGTRAETPALLKGVIRCGHCECSMGPTFTRKNGKMYRYYLCVSASKNGYDSCPVGTVAAGEIEDAVVDQLRAVFRTPEIIARTFREGQAREAEEIERLREAKKELAAQLRTLKTKANRLLEAGANGTVAEELRLTGDEMDDVKRRLETTRADLRTLETHTLTEREVIDALERLDSVWEELFPAERARIVSLLVARVEVRVDGLELRLRSDGLRSLVAELRPEAHTG